MNLNDFMLLVYTFIIIILILYIIIKKHEIIHKHTGIDVYNIYNHLKNMLDNIV